MIPLKTERLSRIGEKSQKGKPKGNNNTKSRIRTPLPAMGGTLQTKQMLNNSAEKGSKRTARDKRALQDAANAELWNFVTLSPKAS